MAAELPSPGIPVSRRGLGTQHRSRAAPSRSRLCYAGCCASSLWSVLIVLPCPALHFLRHIQTHIRRHLRSHKPDDRERRGPGGARLPQPSHQRDQPVRRLGRGGSRRQEGPGGCGAHNHGGNHSGPFGSAPLRLRGDLPGGAPGARLHDGGRRTRGGVSVEIPAGGEDQAFQRPALCCICEFSVKAVLSHITQTNVTTLILGLVCLVFLYGIKDLNERFKKKLPIPIPGEIIVVIVSTGVSYGMTLAGQYNVDVVGKIPTELLPPVAPDFSLIPSLITDSFAIAIVGFSMGISLAKIFALKHNYTVDSNQELIAFGLCNFASSFFQTFTITCSMSRSLVQESTGGKTQIAGLLGSLLVLLVIVAIGFVFEPLPQTALAAIIMVNLLGMFKQFRDIPALWRTSKIELAIWLVTFVASVLLGLDYGLLSAIAFALLTVIYRTQSPKNAVLGQVPGTGLYYDVDEYEEAAECESIKIFHSNSSIYFANSDLYVSALKQKTGVNPEQIQAARKAQKKGKANSCVTRLPKRHAEDKERGTTHEVLSFGKTAGEQTNGSLGEGLRETDSEEVTFLQSCSSVHSIILDWTQAAFIDSVGAKAIKQVIKEYAAVDVRVVIAGCNRSLLSDLDQLQFFGGVTSPEMVFPTLHDAVLHCQRSPPNLSI
ncbi:prestin isoform X2 [Syngnathoides biaculeatus]|uniref:prestin isoform X2 n=1 Tax=Syngnathoides biaculeatus TaxID=300417 RepID=UPI002ADDB1CE|nr:prestin isoform X2 [Syngnathoides biaculeatus]